MAPAATIGPVNRFLTGPPSSVAGILPVRRNAATDHSRCLKTTISTDDWPRVPPLSPVDRGRRAARLLDDDRGGADRGLVGRLARRVGTAARNRCRFRRAADLRVGHGDHVLAQVLLFLRTAAEEPPAGVRVPRPRCSRASGPPRRTQVDLEAGQHHPYQSPRRSRAADYGLASGSLRPAGQTGCARGQTFLAQETAGEGSEKLSFGRNSRIVAGTPEFPLDNLLNAAINPHTSAVIQRSGRTRSGPRPTFSFRGGLP